MTQTVHLTSIQQIEERIAPLRQKLAAHPLYSSIQTEAHLRLFMESHVFAVWDFMSLLKSLQRRLTCVDIPWVPTLRPESRRFINEIVLGEESDQCEGRSISHFELYLEAMDECGADTGPIRKLLTQIATHPDRTGNLHAPPAAKRFVETTFTLINTGQTHALAAAFTFGREDLIPGMFRKLVRDLDAQLSGNLSKFIWYLERHIEVDGDEHGPLSLRMVADLCGDDENLWDQAATAAESAIAARLDLWDGILGQITTAQITTVKGA